MPKLALLSGFKFYFVWLAYLYTFLLLFTVPNLLKKNNGQPTVPMYPGDIPSYSPPSRSFFTPPLPPEYQNPFADKPTLRGTNNDGLIANTVAFNNRRPIPPPSLMPGHERIPFRPPDLAASVDESTYNSVETKNQSVSTGSFDERKKALNTPSRSVNGAVGEVVNKATPDINDSIDTSPKEANKREEVLPNIRRILGSNGKKGDIPAVLLRQVTHNPIVNYQQPPASPIVAVEIESKDNTDIDNPAAGVSPNINKKKQLSSGQVDIANEGSLVTTTPSAAAALGEAATTTFTLSASSSVRPTIPSLKKIGFDSNTNNGASAAAAASAHTTWTWAWNIHIYLSVVLFTILAVYSFYKLLTYNKLSHLFAQSYFVYIHLILISICVMRIFYLCYDAYNIHGTFHLFPSELLLNLPSTFLTVAFSVLILFLFLKSLNHKNNRYSALVRPLTVVVGCGVHVGLCITLHYVESYTMQNHLLYFQQQQQHQQYFRRQYVVQPPSAATTLANPPPPPRVLSLICQIIYIFICLSLGLLYLYIYRILKRILRSKSQNYIHGYQNLSYGIHITIATALLFVLLAVLEIFGAVYISAARSLMSQPNVVVEVDWMQWGYQFSLRLIEIAIITLISWVTGLKTSAMGGTGGTSDIGVAGIASNGQGQSAGVPSNSSLREKHHHSGAHVSNFFLPCTTSSSQEQFETDYPAICNTNTNLHTYTMRTGKLIYDDSYALSSLGGVASPGAGRSVGTDYQLQEPMYQRPYDTGSIQSALNQPQIATGDCYHHHFNVNHKQQQQLSTTYVSADYMTDGTTDHYENPNFDLRKNPAGGEGVLELGVSVSSGPLQKLSKHTTSSGSGSGSGSSGTSQQQMLLLQSDSCYSEPLQENSSYEFSNFERPTFKENSDESWSERNRHMFHARQQNGDVDTLERKSYENPDRRSSNSTNSCTSSNGVRYASYNSYNVRKSGTLQNIGVSGAPHSRSIIPAGMRANGAQTLAIRSHYFRERCGQPQIIDLESSLKQQQKQQQQQQQKEQHQYNHQNSEDDQDGQEGDEEEDDLMPSSQVECTNLISSNQALVHDPLGNPVHHHHLHVQTKMATSSSIKHQPSPNSFESKAATTSSQSSASDSKNVGDQGFPRFRDKTDSNNSSINNKTSNISQLVGIHGVHGVRNVSNALSQICSNVNSGIDC